MKFLRLPLLVVLLILTFCISSCVKDSDLNSDDNTVTPPILESDLFSTTFTTSDFNQTDDNENLQKATDTLNLDYIRSNFFMDEMKQVNLSFKFINSMDAKFKMEFEFLNDDNELKYVVHVPVSSGSIENPIHVETMVTIKEPELKIFKEATKLVYKISSPSKVHGVSPVSYGSIALQSSASFLFDL